MSLLRDVRFALRTLLRRPGFTAAAAVTLALGIGANTAIFSAVRVALIRPLPYPEPERLAMIWELSPRQEPNVVNSGNFLAWQERNRSFDSMAAYAITRANLAGQGAPERVRFGIFTTDLLRTLGVSPLHGRDVEAGDSLPGGQGVVLLSEGYWRRRFGADPEVIGRGLTLNGKAVTVVGVAPRLTLPRSLDESTDVDVWSPLPISERTRTAGGRWLQVVGRLRDGVALEQAGAELETLMAELQRERPDVNARWGVSVAAFHADLVKDVRGALLALMGAVGLLLLIACVNVAGLMLAQALAREREIAVRSALGAGAGRLARQLLTESLVLAALGTGLGLPLGSWMLRGLLALLPGELPLVGEASLDSSVLAFTLAAAVLSAIGFGLVPALRVARPNLVEALKEGGHTSGAGRRRRSLRDALVVAEVAIALVLLVGAGLTVRSFQRLSGVNPGFDPNGALTLQVSLPSASYSDGASQTRYFERALDQLAALPGAESAGVISWRPLGTGSRTSYWPLDRPTPPPGEELVAGVRVIDGDLLEALRIPLLRGRRFSHTDSAEAPRVVLVNQGLAADLWPDQDPVGQHVAMWWGDDIEAEVVGVVGDVRLRTLDTDPGHTLYWPQAQLPDGGMTLVLRTSVPPTELATSARNAVASVDPEVPVAQVETMEQVVSASLGSPRFLLILLGAFAVTAALLAAVGLYGVLAYTVTQRRAELGVRMALGAGGPDVVRLVLRHGMALALTGVALGLPAALLLSRFLESQLFEVSAADPLAYASVSVLLLVIAAVATLVPAWRAARVDPLQALRAE